VKRGDVIFWPMFRFGSEEASNKLLVIMGSDQKDNWLMFRTTSKERADRPDPHGCHADQSVYRFKDNLSKFDVPTWVQFEMEILRERREIENAGCQVKFSLTHEEIRAIINCYKKSPEVASWIAAYMA